MISSCFNFGTLDESGISFFSFLRFYNLIECWRLVDHREVEGLAKGVQMSKRGLMYEILKKSKALKGENIQLSWWKILEFSWNLFFLSLKLQWSCKQVSYYKKAVFKQFPQLKSSDPEQFKNINVLMLPFYLFFKKTDE